MNRIFILIISLCFYFTFSLYAVDNSLKGKDESWLPRDDNEYLAFNFAGFTFLNIDEKLMDNQPDISTFIDEERASLDYRTGLFQMFIDGSLINDTKYSEQEPYLGGRYIYLNDAYLKMVTDNFELKIGRGPHRDIVDSPYSLFISSADISALNGEINYHGNKFFFKTRWVNMSYNSGQIYYGTDTLTSDTPTEGWPQDAEGISIDPSDNTYWLDKGMNFKVYGFDMGDWRWGFEDVVVYLNRPFDVEYFFNPLPQYFLQLFTTEAGVPWVQAGNTKSMIGFFGDINRRNWGGTAQILIDDLNLDMLPWVSSRTFKSKVAWNIGAWKAFDFGTLGIRHAGATKYTFESTRTIESSSDWGAEGYVDVPYSILPYEYAYYPVTEYSLKSGDQMPVYYEDLYAGYKYGENNLAFMVDYENTLFKNTPYEFKLYSYLEYVMNGSKSPANPWQEYDSSRNENIEDSQWVLFSGAPIEHIIRIKATARKRMGNFTFMLETLIGYVFNGIKLVDVPPDYEDFTNITWTEPKIYVPQNGNNFPVFQLSLGVNYSWQVY